MGFPMLTDGRVRVSRRSGTAPIRTRLSLQVRQPVLDFCLFFMLDSSSAARPAAEQVMPSWDFGVGSSEQK